MSPEGWPEEGGKTVDQGGSPALPTVSKFRKGKLRNESHQMGMGMGMGDGDGWVGGWGITLMPVWIFYNFPVAVPWFGGCSFKWQD